MKDQHRAQLKDIAQYHYQQAAHFDPFGKQNPVSAFHRGLVVKIEKVLEDDEPEKSHDLVLRITTAYEQGVGQALRGYRNPYALDSLEFAAWHLGRLQGTKVEPVKEEFTISGATDRKSWRYVMTEMAQRLDDYQMTLACGELMDLNPMLEVALDEVRSGQYTYAAAMFLLIGDKLGQLDGEVPTE